MGSRGLWVTYVILTLLAIGAAIEAGDLGKLSQNTFDSVAVELRTIEKMADASVAREELAVARQYIERGVLLLKGGYIREAAIYAERLNLQVELVRALIAEVVAARKANEVALEIRRLTAEMNRLKQQRQQLLMKVQDMNTGVAAAPSTQRAE